MSDARENEAAVKLGEQLLPYRIRLDLKADPAFVKKYGKKVVAADGSYSTARGNTETRFVYLPCSAEDLINKIWTEFGGCARYNQKTGEKVGVMVVDLPVNANVPAWVTVHEVSTADVDPAYALRCKLALAIMHARERGLIEGKPLTKDEQAAETERQRVLSLRLKLEAEVRQKEQEIEATRAVDLLLNLSVSEKGRTALAKAILSSGASADFLRVACAAESMV